MKLNFILLLNCSTVIFLSLISFTSVHAQREALDTSPKQVTRFLEIGVSANAYKGDLANNYQKWSSAFQAGLKLNFKNRLNSHFNVAVGSITGQNINYTFPDEINPATPNVFFKTSFVAANYDLQLHLLKYKGWMIYISQGFGLIRFEPKDEQNKSLQNNFGTQASNETYNNISLILPTQAGISYVFKNGYGINLQTGWLNQQTDYIDNISEWGNRQKKDNTLWFRFACMAPLTLKKAQ
jgi:hypothetical protein